MCTRRGRLIIIFTFLSCLALSALSTISLSFSEARSGLSSFTVRANSWSSNPLRKKRKEKEGKERRKKKSEKKRESEKRSKKKTYHKLYIYLQVWSWNWVVWLWLQPLANNVGLVISSLWRNENVQNIQLHFHPIVFVPHLTKKSKKKKTKEERRKKKIVNQKCH